MSQDLIETAAAARTIRVVLADDHPLVREGLRAMLDGAERIELVAEVADGARLLEAVGRLQPDVVLVDIRMPDIDGLEAVRRIKEKHPQVRALMLTVHDEDSYVHEAIVAGASGYLLKTVSPAELIEGIRAVAEGKAILHPSVTRKLLDEFASFARDRPDSPKELSPREHDVLQLLAYGNSNKQIARSLGIGAQTVKTHISHIFAKLGAMDRTGAVAIALRKGLVE